MNTCPYCDPTLTKWVLQKLKDSEEALESQLERIKYENTRDTVPTADFNRIYDENSQLKRTVKTLEAKIKTLEGEK